MGPYTQMSTVEWWLVTPRWGNKYLKSPRIFLLQSEMQVGSVGLLASVGTLFLALYIRRRLRALPSEEDDDGWFAL